MITFRWDFVMSDCFDFSSVFTCFNLSYPFIQKKWVKLLLSSLALWFQLAKEIIKTILTNILGSVCHLAKCGHNIHHFFHAINELASVCVPRCFSHVWLFATPWTILHPWDSPRKNTGGDCHVLLHRIFLTQGSNHVSYVSRKRVLYHQHNLGSPNESIVVIKGKSVKREQQY